MAMEKGGKPHGFPDDLFQTGGEVKPEDSSKNTHQADNQTDSSAGHPHPAHNNPFVQPILSFSSRSSSSSSSSGSSMDLFQVDHTKHTATIPPKEEASHHDVSLSNASQPNARVAEEAAEPESAKSFNPRQTPPAQVMDRSENYDPSRIPASVFTPKSSSPMDWSVASNESLFSIQVGNTSFNREQFHLMGLDFPKSRELYKSGELYKPGGDMLYKSGELFSLSPSPPFTIVEMRESTDHDSDLGTPKLVNRVTMEPKIETRLEEYQPQSQSVSTRLSTISSHSDGSGISGASAGSFAFPILTEGKRDSTEMEVSLNHSQKQISKTSKKQSISEQLSTKVPSCSLCCCYCSCSCFSRCKSCCC